MDPVSALDFEKGGGLVTAIAIDVAKGDVLMVAFMNEASLRQTLETGNAVYWSRSKGRLWRKGEESTCQQEEVGQGMGRRLGAVRWRQLRQG